MAGIDAKPTFVFHSSMADFEDRVELKLQKKHIAVVFISSLMMSCSSETPAEELVDMPDQERVDAARRHIDSKPGFYSHMGESRLDSDCGGYSEVYRLFILRTFTQSEVIRIGQIGGEPSLTHSIGHLGEAESETTGIEDSVLDRFRSIVRSSPFLRMQVHTGVWGVDTPKYHFEWCSDGNYYAVEREWNDTDLELVFKFLEDLVADE